MKRAAEGWGGAAGLEAQISVVEQLSPFFLALFAAFVSPPLLLVMALSSVVRAHHVVALTLIVFAHCFSAVQQKCWPKFVHDSSKVELKF